MIVRVNLLVHEPTGSHILTAHNKRTCHCSIPKGDKTEILEAVDISSGEYNVCYESHKVLEAELRKLNKWVNSQM